MIVSLKKIQEERKTSGVSFLHTISQCLEMRPGPSVRKKDLENEDGETLLSFLMSQSRNLIGKIPSEWDIEYDDFLRSMKLTWVLDQWMWEAGEDSLLENQGVTPGELRARLEISDWLFYSMQELGALLNMFDILKDLRKTRLRVRYGIREDLLPLVKLRGVGRVRARNLFNRGFRSIEDLRKAPITSISQIVGPAVSKDIKKQLSGPASQKNDEKQESLDPGISNFSQ
jgi:helicase